MECKFLNHGIALAYQGTVKPCCVWHFDSEYQKNHNINVVNLATWHQHRDLQHAKELLANDVWPNNCVNCKNIEEQGRQDSTRLNGENSYKGYSNDDITLEIRPGSVCNFACQTCWPAASTRVANYYKIANLETTLDKNLLTSIDVDRSEPIDNFNFLLPVAHRIKSVILLGGEPFYDKNCIKFLHWWRKNTAAELIAFTNGSNLDFDFLRLITNKLTLVFSLDAIGKPAEYIRFGTDWSTVWNNINQARSMPNIDVRINITTSAYNFYYLDTLIYQFIDNWPSVITFGPAAESHLTESVIPDRYRKEIKNRLVATIGKLRTSNIEHGQKHNAINAVQSIVDNLCNVPFNEKNYLTFKNFISRMDFAKNININEYCPEVARLIS